MLFVVWGVALIRTRQHLSEVVDTLKMIKTSFDFKVSVLSLSDLKKIIFGSNWN